MMTLGTGGMFSGVNSFPLMTPIRPSGMTPMSTRPDGLDHSTCVKKYPTGLIFQYPRIRTSFPVLVEYSAKPAGRSGLARFFGLDLEVHRVGHDRRPSGVTTGSFSASVTWKVLPDGLNWRVVAMTRRLAASRSRRPTSG